MLWQNGLFSLLLCSSKNQIMSTNEKNICLDLSGCHNTRYGVLPTCYRTNLIHKKHSFSINNKEYKIKLLASSSTDKEAKNQFVIADQDIKAAISYRKYPTQDALATTCPSERTADTLWAVLPSLAPAGKYEYFVTFSSSSEKVTVAENRSEHYPIQGGCSGLGLGATHHFYFSGHVFCQCGGSVCNVLKTHGINSTSPPLSLCC